MKHTTIIWFYPPGAVHPVPLPVPRGADVRLSALLTAVLTGQPVIIAWSAQHAEILHPPFTLDDL